MPHNTLRLIPGIDQNRTPTLNEAALSDSQLIRFVPDRQGLGLPQKLGGWSRFYPASVGATPRSMLAWQDINSNKYLAVACQPASVGAGSNVNVITGGNLKQLTARVQQYNAAVSVTVSTTSSRATINLASSSITSYDAVFVATPIAIGGVVIFGFYQCSAVSAGSFQIDLTDALGSPVFPSSSVTNGGAVPQFAATSGTSLVTVTLAAHGYTVGENFPVLASTTVGGVTLFGEYRVVSVPTANTFTISVSSQATATATVSENAGQAMFNFYYGYGALTAGTGYGVGGYGSGGYGTGTSTPVTPTRGSAMAAYDWTLDNWGEVLVACPNQITFGPAASNPLGGPVYVWSPTSNSPLLSPIPTAPVANAGIFVAMPQRQIVAWGSTFDGVQDPLLVRWCDVEDYTSWIALPTNQAGSYRIPKGSQIIGALQGPQQGLIWTDLAVWAMQYIGAPLVYGFNEIATGCGLIGPKAAASVNGVVYWMSQSQFYRLAGQGVEPLPCPIWDVIFQDIDTSNLNKIRVAVNSRFGEISWFYPTVGSGGEISNYAKYNIGLNQWDYGALSRTAWINQSVLGAPIGADSTGLIFQHETSTNADGQPMTSSFQTGYFALADGDAMTYVDQFWPDAKWGYYDGTQNANLQLTFYVKNYPSDSPQVYGPYTVTSGTDYITPRFRGRLVSIKIGSSDANSFWRMGAMRYRYSPDGRF